MKKLTQINGTNINYVEFNTAANWSAHFPNIDWVLIIIADNRNTNYFDEIIRKAIDRNVICITSVGKEQNLIHDMADEEILIRSVENLYLPEHPVMTIGETNFEEGIFSGIFLPLHAEENLKEIILLDVDKSNYERLDEVVQKFKKKYN